MTIKPKLLFILIGDDKTGKTTLQKLLIERICGIVYDTLPTNKHLQITHPEIKRKFKDISFANRSYQEKKDTYGSIEDYFKNHFSPADICFISSHLVLKDVEEMINESWLRYYNVFGVFWSNSIENNGVLNSQISNLHWDERLVIDNPVTGDNNLINKQLNSIADNFVTLLTNRTSIS